MKHEFLKLQPGDVLHLQPVTDGTTRTAFNVSVYRDGAKWARILTSPVRTKLTYTEAAKMLAPMFGFNARNSKEFKTALAAKGVLYDNALTGIVPAPILDRRTTGTAQLGQHLDEYVMDCNSFGGFLG